MALPDALLALWFKWLGEAVLQRDAGLMRTAAFALGLSATATWLLGVLSSRMQRRFRDKITIALEAHVARLQASVATIAHQERPDYLDRLAMLRDQVFVLDHMYMSVFSTCGWIVRLAVTIALLMSIHPALVLLAVFAAPTALTSMWRPGIERVAQQRAAPFNRLARHLFTTATTAPPGKEVRVTGIGDRLVTERREAWASGFGPVSAVRWRSAGWHTLAWAIFGGAYVGAVVFVSSYLHASAGNVLLVLAAGSRLSAYVGATVGELGFLTGFWAYGARRLAWLEDYAASLVARADLPVPARLVNGIRLDHVSFAYPGTERLVLDDVNLELPAGAVVAVVGENGAGKSTLVKLLAKLYEPTSGQILVDGVDLARMHADEWRARLTGAFQDFFRFEFRARHTVGVGDVPRLDDEPAVVTAVAQGGRGRCGGQAPGGAADAARADVAGRRRGVVRAMAEARARARLHARPPAAARARRADGRARRRDRARAVRTVRRGRGGRGPRRGQVRWPHHDPRLAPLQHGPHGRPHRRARRRESRRGRVARRSPRRGGQYSELYGIQAAAYGDDGGPWSLAPGRLVRGARSQAATRTTTDVAQAAAGLQASLPDRLRLHSEGDRGEERRRTARGPDGRRGPVSREESWPRRARRRVGDPAEGRATSWSGSMRRARSR